MAFSSCSMIICSKKSLLASFINPLAESLRTEASLLTVLTSKLLFHLLVAEDNELKIKLNFSPKCEGRSEEHTSELQSRPHLVCRLLLEKKKKKKKQYKK